MNLILIYAYENFAFMHAPMFVYMYLLMYVCVHVCIMHVCFMYVCIHAYLSTIVTPTEAR